jgi:hypothetical protein
MADLCDPKASNERKKENSCIIRTTVFDNISFEFIKACLYNHCRATAVPKWSTYSLRKDFSAKQFSVRSQCKLCCLSLTSRSFPVGSRASMNH